MTEPKVPIWVDVNALARMLARKLDRAHDPEFVEHVAVVVLHVCRTDLMFVILRLAEQALGEGPMAA